MNDFSDKLQAEKEENDKLREQLAALKSKIKTIGAAGSRADYVDDGAEHDELSVGTLDRGHLSSGISLTNAEEHLDEASVHSVERRPIAQSSPHIVEHASDDEGEDMQSVAAASVASAASGVKKKKRKTVKPPSRGGGSRQGSRGEQSTSRSSVTGTGSDLDEENEDDA